jgi:hypothetical protein
VRVTAAHIPSRYQWSFSFASLHRSPLLPPVTTFWAPLPLDHRFHPKCSDMTSKPSIPPDTYGSIGTPTATPMLVGNTSPHNLEALNQRCSPPSSTTGCRCLPATRTTPSLSLSLPHGPPQDLGRPSLMHEGQAVDR